MGSSHSSTTTNGTQNTQVIPTNPDWVTNGLANLGDHVNALTNTDPSSFVSGPNALQTQAGNTVGGLGRISEPLTTLAGSTLGHLGGLSGTLTNSATNNLNAVGGLSSPALGSAANTLTHLEGTSAPTINGGGGMARISPYISELMNPNLRSVVDPSLAAFDYGAGQNLAQNALTQAGTDSAFGGSGAALAAAATNQQNALGRGQLASQLYGNAYDTALGGATNQANLQEQASQRALQASIAQANAVQQNRLQAMNAANSLANVGLSTDQNFRANAGALQDLGLSTDANTRDNASAYQNLGLTTDANQRANAGAQGAVGDDLRQITQQQLTAPLSTAATIAGIYGSMPLSLLHGQDQNQQTHEQTDQTYTPSIMSQIGQGLGIAGSLATGLGGLGVFGAGGLMGQLGAGSLSGLGGLGSGLGLMPMQTMTSGVSPATLAHF